ncbi:MAG TPA: dihydroneopterin triphosphate diphosphatase [Burkholderiales bacterium]|nr:dihydroneopterin triphosphate diphosphatase [Burkholderiales bacterium]
MAYKIPVSVLVVIHTTDLHVLLMERASAPGFWQSVTGSRDTDDEPLETTAVREVAEETGIDATRYSLRNWRKQNQFEIFARWRGRYAPGVTHNVEHVFSLELPAAIPVQLAPTEHLQYLWLPWQAAADKVFSWSNADAIRELSERRH